MREVTASTGLVAYCGLYCGACKSYLAERCPGCQQNEKATWCALRSCCQAKGIASCAGCEEFADPRACGKFNNLISKFFALVFRSDRAACIAQIKSVGLDGHAQAMAAAKQYTVKR